MKKLSILLLSIFCIAALASCDKGEMGPVMNNNPGSPSITSPESGQSYMLSEEQSDDTLMTLEWTNPDYGFPSAPQYIVQMDSTTQGFNDPMQLATATGTSHSVTVGEMNGVLLGAGFAGGEEVTLDIRVIANLSDSVEQQVSDPITLSFTPYSICQYCPEIYVPGGYQAASGYTNNWDPGTAPALETVDDTDQYSGYVYMANADNQFKFTADRNWSLNWGDDGADGTLENNGSNISASASGYYLMNVDLNNMTYSMTNTTWGVIGSATADGWNSDQDMTYDPQAKVWTVTLDLTSGEMKFRANNDWAINYGDNGADGTLERDGSNIAIGSAGNYTIELNLSSKPYSYTVTQN